MKTLTQLPLHLGDLSRAPEDGMIRVLNRDESAMMVNAIFMEQQLDTQSARKAHADAMTSLPTYDTLVKRLQKLSPVHAKRCTIPLLIWCDSMSQNFGDIALWVWTLHNMGEDNPDKPLTLGLLCGQDWFPTGTPTEAGLMKIWDGQKCRALDTLGEDSILGNAADNLIDYCAAYRGAAGLAELNTAIDTVNAEEVYL